MLIMLGKGSTNYGLYIWKRSNKLKVKNTCSLQIYFPYYTTECIIYATGPGTKGVLGLPGLTSLII